MVRTLTYIISITLGLSIISCVPERDVFPNPVKEANLIILSSKKLMVNVTSGDSSVILVSGNRNSYSQQTINYMISLPLGMNEKSTTFDLFYPDHRGTLKLTYNIEESWNESGKVSIDYENLRVDSSSTFDRLFKSAQLKQNSQTSKYYYEYTNQITEPSLLDNDLRNSKYKSVSFYIDEYL